MEREILFVDFPFLLSRIWNKKYELSISKKRILVRRFVEGKERERGIFGEVERLFTTRFGKQDRRNSDFNYPCRLDRKRNLKSQNAFFRPGLPPTIEPNQPEPHRPARLDQPRTRTGSNGRIVEEPFSVEI